MRWVGPEEGEAPVVVLLHGWGAPGATTWCRSLGICDAARGCESRCPAAPVERPPTGRAWWPIDPEGLRRPTDRGEERRRPGWRRRDAT
ncbi:MAG: hypothetical protein SangKO_068640 [Sandaracinaceae bacterium]